MAETTEQTTSEFTLTIRGTCKDPNVVNTAILEFVERLKSEFGCEFADGRMRTMSERRFGNGDGVSGRAPAKSPG